MLFPFGDGSDGNATISSTTTLTEAKHYADLTVNSTLKPMAIRVFVKGKLTVNGSGGAIIELQV